MTHPQDEFPTRAFSAVEGNNRNQYSQAAPQAYDDRYDYLNEPNYGDQVQSPAPEYNRPTDAPTGLAAKFNVNELISDVAINAAIVAIGGALAAWIVELLLGNFLPDNAPMNVMGGGTWALTGFIALIAILATFGIGIALDGKSNATTLFSMIVWLIYVAALVLLGLLPHGFTFTLIPITVMLTFFLVGALWIPRILDNHRVKQDSRVR